MSENLKAVIIVGAIALLFAGIWLHEVLFGLDGKYPPSGPVDEDFHYN